MMRANNDENETKNVANLPVSMMTRSTPSPLWSLAMRYGSRVVYKAQMSMKRRHVKFTWGGFTMRPEITLRNELVMQAITNNNWPARKTPRIGSKSGARLLKIKLINKNHTSEENNKQQEQTIKFL